jgi:thioredoxin reductase (NADPH)
MMYDVIIVGGGPAAMSAAIYAARYKMSTLVLAKEIGGTIALASTVEDYPGFKSISGLDLMQRFREHVEHFGVDIKQEEVRSIKKEKMGFRLFTNEGEYEAKSVLLCLGTIRRRLNIPGEDEFAGRGVSYCATCDAPFFKDKVVGVVGGGNAATGAALLLSKYAKQVYIIIRKDTMRADPAEIEMVKNNPKIEIIKKTNVVEIKGKDFVENVIFDSGEEFKLDGLFIEIGAVPSSTLVKPLGVKLDENGYIVTNEAQETNVEGIYAAGDITTGSNGFQQVVTAVSEGAIAINSVYKYVNRLAKDKETTTWIVNPKK